MYLSGFNASGVWNIFKSQASRLKLRRSEYSLSLDRMYQLGPINLTVSRLINLTVSRFHLVHIGFVGL